MKLYLLIAVAGAAGAVSRHAINIGLAAWLGRGFPWGTLSVNLIGSALMGFLSVWLAARWQWPLEYRVAVLTGFLGSFTTMSAFAVDTLALFERQNWLWLFFYVLVTVLGAIIFLRAGMLLAERLTG